MADGLLDKEIGEESAKIVIDAISMIRGVASVTPVVADGATHMAEVRADREWLGTLYDFIGVAGDIGKRDRLRRLLKELRESGG